MATAQLMPMDSDRTLSVACCDVDADGDPPTWSSGTSAAPGRGQNRLYLNDGSGTLTDATASRLPMDTDLTWGVACCDVDGDGDPDLVFANGFGEQNRLYLNDGGGTFSDATGARMPVNTGLTLSRGVLRRRRRWRP